MASDNGLRVAALGASAGGLDAFRTILTRLPNDTGMAFIVVQHLDPSHASMMVTLLRAYTQMPVTEAVDGMKLEPNRLYVIPPGRYLTASNGKLRVFEMEGGGRTHMPFDYLLESLAEVYGEHAACAVLSGTASDGSMGAIALQKRGGLVIAQDPEEAEFDSMPRNAITTGAVDLVLPLHKIAESLIDFAKHGKVPSEARKTAQLSWDKGYSKILDLLHERSGHDFEPHKQGTLVRRISRRMSLANLSDAQQYAELIEKDPAELARLVDDLFINVTSFFREPSSFNLLGTTILPEILRDHPYDRPFRAWVAGCSTGEEAYSLAIILDEAIAATKRSIKLMIFASDIDEEAIAFAREGFYPSKIEENVTPARLARYFVKENSGYRVRRELRDLVVFSVHDLLSDAPFSRIDLISCVNVLIYLRPEVQRKVLNVFHFALNEGGILFLGSAGPIGEADGHFVPIAKKERIFRHVGRSRPGELELPGGRGTMKTLLRRVVRRPPPRGADISELTQRALLENFAPASALINQRNEGLYYYGPVDRYLRLVGGEPNQTILAAAREGLRSSLRIAIEKARRENARTVVAGAAVRNGDTHRMTIDVQPVKSESEALLLVSFIDEPPQPEQPQPAVAGQPAPQLSARIVQLERDLEATRKDLDEALRERELAEEELNATNEEAMSLNEEFQTTNEELQTSKEEMQSLNEELTTLNAQLQETVDRERGIADDLHNVLNSTDVGTLFLDEGLNIRFFTPAVIPLFNLIPTDIGRPLVHLARHFTDDSLIDDAHTVLAKVLPIVREISGEHGTTYMRRILPYRTKDNQVRGIVITFVDITQVKAAQTDLATARAYTESMVGEFRGPTLVLDENLRVVSASRSFYRLFAADAANTIGHNLANVAERIIDVKELPRFLDLLRTNLAGLADYEMEVSLPRLGRRSLIFNAVEIPQELNTPPRILLAMDDVTARKEAQRALIAAKELAEKASLGKSRFLATVSHDLRQPMQTLVLLQALLEKKALNADTLDLIVRMGEALSAMNGLLETLLGLSQLELGVVTPKLGSFLIGDLLQRLRTEFTYHTESRGLALRFVDCGQTVRSDPALLEQMLRNLLANAVKYTEKGKILLGCRRRGETLRIEIWDTGIGIPRDQLRSVFEEFHQVDNPEHRMSHGVGLGLFIVRRLGDMLSHAVDVRSRPGHGSCFCITVPISSFRTRPESSIAVGAAKPSPGARVMIIEDDPSVRRALETLLKEEGYATESAVDGKHALELAAGDGFRANLIIADYNLPTEPNGLQVVTQLREKLGQNVRVIILTGDVSADAVSEISRRGFAYRSKPIAPQDLSRLVASLLATPFDR